MKWKQGVLLAVVAVGAIAGARRLHGRVVARQP